MRITVGKPSRTQTILMLVCVLAILSGSWMASWLNHRLIDNTTRLTIEANVPAGTRFGIYYNNRPVSDRLPIVPNEWHSYVYKVPPVINILRLDPTEVANTVTQIRSITVSKGKSNIRKLDLSTLPSWVKFNTEITFDRASNLLTFRATGPEQFAMSTLDVNLGRTAFGGAEADSVSFLWACLVAGAIYFVLQTRELGWATTGVCVAIAAGAFAATRIAPALVPYLHLMPVPPSDALGNPTFTFTSKPAEMAMAAIGILTALAVVWIYVLFDIRLRRRPLYVDSTPTSLQRSCFLFIGLVVFLCAVLSLPDLQGICLSDFHVIHDFLFDPQQGTIWESMVHQGLLPDRDFWYPYSGLYNKLAPLYPELLMSYLHNLAVFSVMTAATYVLFGKRKLATVVVMLFLLPLAEANGVVWPDASWRYLLGVSVVIFVGAALCTRSLPWFLLSGGWSSYVLSQESAQFVYAIPALFVLIFAVVLASESRAARIQLLRLLKWNATAFGLCTSVWLVMMMAEHRLANWWAYMSELDTQAHYFAFPFEVSAWFRTPTSIETFGYSLILLLFIFGSIQLFRRNGPVPASYMVPLSIAGVSAMILQKEVLRPGIMSQFIAIPMFGLIMVLVQYSSQLKTKVAQLFSRSVRVAWASFACAFLTVLFFVDSGAWAAVQTKYSQRLRTLGPNLAYAVGHQRDWQAAANYFFSPASIDMEGVRGDVAKSEYLKATAGAPGKIFALGDDAYWYLLLDQRPPYYTMFFHQAPLDAQKTTVDWLEKNQPRYVIWDPALRGVDDVPSPVRVPLLYTYVAANYVPATKVRNFLVLQRRAAGQAADLAFWNNTLTSNVDLGYVPALSQLLKNVSESSGAPVSFLVVHIPTAVTGRSHIVPIQLGAVSFTVSFREQSTVKDYPIRLDRLALIAAAAANGIEPTVSGNDCSIRHAFLRRDLLY